MSIIDSGRYRLRKDWASASIPSLVDIDEHVSDEVENSLNITTPLPPPKPPRRSSLALGLFSSKGDKSQKRRSSIAVFLRRDSNKNTTKDSYESAVKHEKSDGSNTPASPEISFSSAEHVRASSPNEPGKVTYFDDGSSLRPIVKGINNAYDSPVDKERNRRRRSSLQAKLERHRRKNNDISQLSIDNSLPSGSQSDLTNGSMGGSTIGASSGDLSGGDIDPNHSAYFPRQKRHSWWNIFVPDNLKTRSRRASQDVSLLSRSVDNLAVPVRRSKSRSVDHGLAAPFDLDSLRSKVEGRFESVDRLTNILEGLRPGSPKPGHIERVDSAKSTDNAQAEANKSDDPVITQRFLKINVRHITDGQGVVGGVLLVTPNAVMFDPNVSDPLVIEHGPESYGVIAPMDLVVNAAIFHDIAHMRVSGGVNTEQNENAEIYYPQAVLEAKQAKEAKERGDESVDGARKQSATGGSMETCDDQESLCSNTGEREQKDAEKGVEAKEESAKTDDEVNTKANKTEDDADANDLKKTLNLTDSRTTLEERRKSLLDHHWAIPSKDRLYYLNSRRSSEDEGDNESQTTIDSGARGQDPHSATSSISGIGAASGALQLPGGLAPADLEHLEELAKQSCYDSGIDIREPIANLQPIPKKTVYSDADIVLSSDWVPPKTISPTLMSESPPRSSVLSAQSLDAGTAGGRKKTTSVSFSVDDNNSEQQAAAAVAASAAAAAAQGDKSTEKKNKMLKRLSYPLAWVEGLTGEAGGPPGTGGSLGKSADSESAPNTGDSNQSVFSKVFSSSPITLVSELGGNLFSKTPSEDSGGSPVPPLTPHSTHSEGHISTGRSSIGTFMRPQSSEGTASTTKLKDVKQQPKLDYRSMVSVDDKPELFISVDKLIPRPARACPDPPLYLRLRMGKPIGKAIPLPTSVMSYGKNKLRPEYWFSVPKNRVDELYRFINTWVQHLYGELNEEQIKARGFELIQDDTEWTKSGSGKSGRSGSQENEEISDLTRESWELIKAPFAKTYSIIKTAKHAASHEMDLLSGEVLSMSTDDYRKASLFATGSFDLDFPIPDLIGTTEILTEEHREKLCGHLPARAEGYSWSLIFSTSQHGFSLNSLYRKMQKLESPILIVIQDTDNNVFGALTSCSLHVSDHFYGTGESLLYKFNPSFKVFHWTGENLYFIKGNMESLSIGAGDGRFGLWLDGDLNQGRSQSCSTYGNEPLAPQEDFVIKTLECWAFV
ncbi:nuclear receptor coactivator 7 isoform X10 [Bactrocera dorsalis]|uniref:Oxidation resistance protein 1 n=1 Tax=Bactrocera dorsalis TaxID=27457 RepID=A0ABM3JB69_BACDO|nr:nuclear receptor coactivator 7 isoform X10 [Bactrocera dorsalis]